MLASPPAGAKIWGPDTSPPPLALRAAAGSRGSVLTTRLPLVGTTPPPPAMRLLFRGTTSPALVVRLLAALPGESVVVLRGVVVLSTDGAVELSAGAAGDEPHRVPLVDVPLLQGLEGAVAGSGYKGGETDALVGCTGT